VTAGARFFFTNWTPFLLVVKVVKEYCPKSYATQNFSNSNVTKSLVRVLDLEQDPRLLKSVNVFSFLQQLFHPVMISLVLINKVAVR